MKVFLTGATGVLGARVVDRLSDRGHDVIGLVRDEQGAETVEDRGGTARRGDVLEADTLKPATSRDLNVVVHAATAIPTSDKPGDEEWERNDRVRLGGARNLVDALGDSVDRFVFPSVVWLARQPDGSEFDEDAKRHPGRATRSAADTEEFLQNAGGDHGFDVTVLRYGYFYAADSAHNREFAKRLLDGDMPIIGAGLLGRRDARLSFIHADDAASAMGQAIEDGVTGIYHVVDENPVSLARFLEASADALDAPKPRRVPAWLARLFVGSVTAEMLSNPMPTRNDRFKRATDWEPEYPTYREGIDQVVDAWVTEGSLRETADGYEWVEQ